MRTARWVSRHWRRWPTDAGGPTFAYSPRDDLSPAADDHLTVLIVLQRADGSWPASEAFAAVSGLELDALRTATEELGLGGQEGEAAVATLAALHILRRDYADRSDEWALPAGKAERLVGGQRSTSAFRPRLARRVDRGGDRADLDSGETHATTQCSPMGVTAR